MTRIAPKTLRHGVFRALHLFLTAESNESELLEEPSFCESCCELSRTSERERDSSMGHGRAGSRLQELQSPVPSASDLQAHRVSLCSPFLSLALLPPLH